jgi:hypothetical protein
MLAPAMVALLLAGCGQSDTRSETAGGASASSVVADAEAKAAAIQAQTGGAATQSAVPKRRDGWWELASYTADCEPMARQNMCVGAGSEEGFSVFDQVNAVGCENARYERAGPGWNFELSCELMGMKTASKGRITGDFSRSFRVDQTVTTDGSTRTGSIRGVHKGSCPAPFKAGDLVSNGAVIMNVAG